MRNGLMIGLVVLAVAGWGIAGWSLLRTKAKPESYGGKIDRLMAEAMTSRDLKLWGTGELDELLQKDPKKARQMQMRPIGVQVHFRSMRGINRGRWYAMKRIGKQHYIRFEWEPEETKQAVKISNTLPVFVRLVCFYSYKRKVKRKPLYVMELNRCRFWRPKL